MVQVGNMATILNYLYILNFIIVVFMITNGQVSSQEIIERSFQNADAVNGLSGTYSNATCLAKNAVWRQGVGCVCTYGNTYSTQSERCERDTVLTQGCDTRFLAPGDSAIQLRSTAGLKSPGVDMHYCGGAWCLNKYQSCEIVSAHYDGQGWKQLWTNESHEQDFSVEINSDQNAILKLTGRPCSENVYNGMLLRFNFRCNVIDDRNVATMHDTCAMLRIVGRFEASRESVLGRVINSCGAFVPPTEATTATPQTTPEPSTASSTSPVIVTQPSDATTQSPTTPKGTDEVPVLPPGGTGDSGTGDDVAADKAILTTVIIVSALAVASIIIVITVICRNRMKRRRHERLRKIKMLKEQENKKKEMLPSASTAAFYIHDSTDSGFEPQSRESTLSDQQSNQLPISGSGMINNGYTSNFYDELIIPEATGSTNAIYALAKGHPRSMPYSKSELYSRHADSGQGSIVSEPSFAPSRRPRCKTETPARYRDKVRHHPRRNNGGRSHNSMQVDEGDYYSDSSRQHGRSRSRPRSYPSQINEIDSLGGSASDIRPNKQPHTSPKHHRSGPPRHHRRHRDEHKSNSAPGNIDSTSLSSYQSEGRHRRKKRDREHRRHRRRRYSEDDDDEDIYSDDLFIDDLFAKPWANNKNAPVRDGKLRANRYSTDLESDVPAMQVKPNQQPPAFPPTTSLTTDGDEFILPGRTLAYVTNNDNIALNSCTSSRRPWAPIQEDHPAAVDNLAHDDTLAVHNV